MGNRYGRQKKRKALDKIKNLESSMEALSIRANNSEEAMRFCAKTLGYNYIGLPAKDARSYVYVDYYRVSRPSFSSYIDQMGLDRVADSVCEMVSDIGVMKSSVLRDELRGQVHVRVTHPEIGVIGYSATVEAMKSLPGHLFVEMISKEIAMQLSRNINGAGL